MSATDDVQEGPPSTREMEAEPKFDIVDPDGAMADWNRIVAMFTYHKPSEDQVERMEVLRIHARVLMREVLDSCPDNPERFTAVQKLRETIMWANASIVLDGKL